MDRGKQAANATTENWKTEDYRRRILKDITDALLRCSVHDQKFSAADHIQSVKRFEEHVHYSAKTENEYRSLLIEKVKSIRVEPQKAADAKNQLRSPSDSAETTEGIIEMQEHVYQRLQNLKNKYYSVVCEIYQKLCTKLLNGTSTLNSTEMDKFRQIKRSMEYLLSLFEMSKSDITPDMKDRATEADNYIQMLLKTDNVAKEQQSPIVEHQAGIQTGSSQRGNVNQLPSLKVSEKPTLSTEEHSPAEQRIINALTSISPETLSEAFTEMEEEICLNDELELPNFVIPEEWKICRNFVATAYENPIICPSTDGGFNKFGAFQCSPSKRPRIEENSHLLAEIKEINNRLFECEVIIYEKENYENEVGLASDSIQVKIIYKAETINQDLISQFTSDKKSLIKPLWLLIPASYPSSSLVILDELPVKVCDDLRALFERAKGKLRCSVESMNKPWLVKDVARAWERCVREAIIDYAEANGGGTFTSMYGGWDVC